MCRFCDRERELRLSHIIPRFVCVRLKRMPGSKPRLIRDEDTTDWVQDGPKMYLLCAECEQELGKWEKKFNDEFLTPFFTTESLVKEYGDWLPKFCALMAWRVATAMTEEQKFNDAPDAVRTAVGAARNRWRAFVKGQLQSPVANELHIMPLDNRAEWFAYSEGAIETGLVASEEFEELYVRDEAYRYADHRRGRQWEPSCVERDENPREGRSLQWSGRLRMARHHEAVLRKTCRMANKLTKLE